MSIIFRDQPGRFALGPLELDVPPDQIQTTRLENQQLVQYLRAKHSVKIPSGRSAIRVDVAFKLFVGESLEDSYKLKQLIALSRVAPFIPVTNDYLREHLPLFSTSSAGETPEPELWGDSIPMAIVALNVMVGGDSPEVIDCQVSLLFWNPSPWIGLEAVAWNSEAAIGSIQREMDRYINVIDSIPIRQDPAFTEMTWFDILSYSELKDKYRTELPDPEQQAAANAKDNKPTPNTEKQEAPNDFEKRLAQAAVKYINAPAQLADRVASVTAVRIPPRSTPSEHRGPVLLPGQKTNDEDELNLGDADLTVTSPYGPRQSSSTSATFHRGVDLRAKFGTPVVALFPGKVTVGRQLVNAGTNKPPGAGLFIKIFNQDTGLETIYAHLSEAVVVTGNQVQPGQLVGRTGNDGGLSKVDPHLHFALKRNGQYDPNMESWLKSQAIKPFQLPSVIAAQAAPEVARDFTFTAGRDPVDSVITYYYDKMIKLPTKAQSTLNLWHQGALPQDPILRTVLSQVFEVQPGDKLTGSEPPTGSALAKLYFDATGKVVAKLPVIVDPVLVDFFGKKGWHRIDDDIRPTNPLFRQDVEPHKIKLTPNQNPVARPQQVVSAISVAFQNRFALLPISGWPYPTIQHMGCEDSDIRLGVALLSDNEKFPQLRDVQQMLHSMAMRAIKYRSNCFTGSDVFALTEMEIDNRFLNLLGLNKFIMTDLTVNRDPESPELIRLELGLTENGLEDEQLQGEFSWSDDTWRSFLRGWLENKKWASDPEVDAKWGDTYPADNIDTSLKGYASKIFGLWQAVEEAWKQSDKRIQLFRAGDRRVQIVPPKADPNALTRSDVARPPVSRLFDVDYSYVQMMSAKVVVADPAYYRVFLESLPADQWAKPEAFPVPIESDQLLNERLWGIMTLIWRNFVGGLPNGAPEYPRGAAMRYLEGEFGPNVKQAIEVLARTEQQTGLRGTQVNTSRDLVLGKVIADWLEVWNAAHRAWYMESIIDTYLLALARDFPQYFQKFRRDQDKNTGTERGCYRDLGLGRDLETNPYDWLDTEHLKSMSDGITRLVNAAIDYIPTIMTYNQMLEQTEDMGTKTGDYQLASSNQWMDVPKLTRRPEKAQQTYSTGVDAYVDNQKGKHGTIEDALSSVKYLQPVQFTVRRAFPTFKFYFIEEEQGLLKTFDDFFSFNAVIDWNLIEQRNRPTVLVMTLGNIFGHLDAIVLNETTRLSQLGPVGSASYRAGEQPLIDHENNNANVQMGVDGRTQAFGNIMLKPGTKIVLKAGYDNDPARLSTIFAGQITDITWGDVMTIVSMDWSSELMGTWDPERQPFANQAVQWLSAADEDVTGTAGTRMMIKAILSHQQCRHFGYWQIGGANPFTLGAYEYIESTRLTPASVLNGSSASNRCMDNVRPSLTPFYSVFGLDPEIEPVAFQDRSCWDILQELRLRHPNNIAVVKPYGSGDATLFFGLPYGVYTHEDFLDNRGNISEKLEDDIMYQEFKQMIHDDAKIYMNRMTPQGDSAPLGTDVGYVEKKYRGIKSFFNMRGQASESSQPVTVSDVLSRPDISEYLFRHTAHGGPYFYAQLEAATAGKFKAPWVADERYKAPWAKNGDVPLSPPGVARDSFESFGGQLLNSQCDEKIVRIYWKALQENRQIGNRTQAETSAITQLDQGNEPITVDRLEYIRTLINQRIADGIHMRFSQLQPGDHSAEAEAVRQLAFLTRPIRQWHIATSKHHIIVNNIELNSRFANRVVVGDPKNNAVQFDPGLVDTRTRVAVEWAAAPKTVQGYMACNILAEEMRKMYRGEIILTGNPEIHSHDILLILDEYRQIYGIVEVERVVHAMALDTGYISIITPALVCEVGDMSISHAYQALYNAFQHDMKELNDQGAFGQALAKLDTFGMLPQTVGDIDQIHAQVKGENPGVPEGQSANTAQVSEAAGAAAVGTGLMAIGTGGLVALYIASAPVSVPATLILAGGALVVGGWWYMGWHNNQIRDQFKQHPLTITPLARRGLPFVAGIDGALGRTVIAQRGMFAVKGIRGYQKLADAGAELARFKSTVDRANDNLNQVKALPPGRTE